MFSKWIQLIVVGVAFCFSASSIARAEGTLDVDAVEKAIGAKGVFNDDEKVLKVSFPRTDVKVSVDGVEMPPFMGLTSWASFHAGTNGAMVMGDIVLLQDEISPAMDAAFAGGLTVTGLHNHFLFDEPRVFFMHIGGEALPGPLAGGVKGVLDAVKKVRAGSSQLAKGFGHKALPPKSAITAGPLAELIGTKPAEKDGMAKFVIGRTVKMACRCLVGKEMGVNTWAAFYGSDDNAFVDGDFATSDGELQAVLQSLRKSGIHVVAIHNHMEGETPKLVFLHYWGRGIAGELAKGIKSALAAQKAAAELKAAEEKAG